MRVYISNYSRYKGESGVQISVSKPKWSTVTHKLDEATPDWEIVCDYKDGFIDEKQYEVQYMAQLEREKEIILRKIRDGECYLCYCAKGVFCHRYLFAKFLMAKGVEVIEI